MLKLKEYYQILMFSLNVVINTTLLNDRVHAFIYSECDGIHTTKSVDIPRLPHIDIDKELNIALSNFCQSVVLHRMWLDYAACVTRKAKIQSSKMETRLYEDYKINHNARNDIKVNWTTSLRVNYKKSKK